MNINMEVVKKAMEEDAQKTPCRTQSTTARYAWELRAGGAPDRLRQISMQRRAFFIRSFFASLFGTAALAQENAEPEPHKCPLGHAQTVYNAAYLPTQPYDLIQARPAGTDVIVSSEPQSLETSGFRKLVRICEECGIVFDPSIKPRRIE